MVIFDPTVLVALSFGHLLSCFEYIYRYLFQEEEWKPGNVDGSFSQTTAFITLNTQQ